MPLFWRASAHLAAVGDLLGEVKLEAECQLCIRHPPEERGLGPLATLADILTPASFVTFLGMATVPHARPKWPNLLPGVQIVLSVCPASYTQPWSQKYLLSKVLLGSCSFQEGQSGHGLQHARQTPVNLKDVVTL